MKELQTNTQYLHAGEEYSKLLFLDTTRKQKSTLHILDISHQKNFIKISQNAKIPYHRIENLQDIQNLQAGGFCGSLDFEIFIAHFEKNFLRHTLSLQIGNTIPIQELAQKLSELGYEFHEYEKAGSYKILGDICQVMLDNTTKLQISFWGDEIENIFLHGKNISEYTLFSFHSLIPKEASIHTIPLWKFLAEKEIFFVFDGLEFQKDISQILSLLSNKASFDILENTIDWKNTEDLNVTKPSIYSIEDLKEILSEKKFQKSLSTRHGEKISEFLEKNNLSHIPVFSLEKYSLESFLYKNMLHIGDDILSGIFIKKRKKKKLSAELDLMLKIQNGDFVVHIDHGIGKFHQIVKKQLGNIEKDYMEIHYLGEDKLFVPLEEIARVSKYVGSENPVLTPLGGKIWERKMAKAHQDIQLLAETILENFAQRKLRESQENILKQEEINNFQNAFPYEYTEDQEQAISEIFEDMQSKKNMDRLIVGDVGFGKTEIAFNAAFFALSNKKQVIFISPLVVLAHEHFAKSLERFAGFGYTIKVLTRLQSDAQAQKILSGLANGSINMVIGTHRLLSEKIVYKNLGLMIVDEEHKFGVSDKEKIKSLRANVDILSLSATPIPRSLNLALSGMRDMSLLKTPPKGRKSIETSVIRFNEAIIKTAGEREFARGGQLFFVHNRVTNIDIIAKQLQEIFPKKKIIITHGRLPGDELEDRILAFKNKKYDILVSTTVIENGIDFSNVNTIFINECQSFGISQIHQLRGRVGRSQTQGYCYLLYKKEDINQEAAKRLQTIVDYSYLGAGFELAMKDLEIRGGGDILGIRQSGQASEIGMSLFLKMLEEKIEDIKQKDHIEKQEEDKIEHIKHPSVNIDILIPAGVPDEYFTGESDKLNFYREIESLQDHEEIDFIEQELLQERNNLPFPHEMKNLFLLLHLQIELKNYFVKSLKKVGIHYQIDFSPDASLENLKNFLKKDEKIVFFIVEVHKIRSKIKDFENDEKFLEYLLHILRTDTKNKKIKIKK